MARVAKGQSVAGQAWQARLRPYRPNLNYL